MTTLHLPSNKREGVVGWDDLNMTLSEAVERRRRRRRREDEILLFRKGFGGFFATAPVEHRQETRDVGMWTESCQATQNSGTIENAW